MEAETQALKGATTQGAIPPPTSQRTVRPALAASPIVDIVGCYPSVSPFLLTGQKSSSTPGPLHLLFLLLGLHLKVDVRPLTLAAASLHGLGAGRVAMAMNHLLQGTTGDWEEACLSCRLWTHTPSGVDQHLPSEEASGLGQGDVNCNVHA